MKRMIIVLFLCSLAMGCAPAAFMAAGAAADDAEKAKIANCFTRYGFTPGFEYGYIPSVDPVHQFPTQTTAMTRAYIARVMPDSYAAKNNILEGDEILKVNGKELHDGYATLDTMIEAGDERFNQMTLKNTTGEVYTVRFNGSK